jgi:predicted Zn-dependent peptidase
MLLFVVGNVDPEKTMDLIRNNQSKKTFNAMPQVDRFYPQEPEGVAKEKSVIYLPVGIPKCFMGFKDKSRAMNGEPWLKREVEMEILMDILFSPGSAIYQKLYEQGLINDGFGADFTGEQYYGFSMIGGDTKDPEQMVALVTDELKTKGTQGIDEESFNLSKRKKIGEFLRSLNSLEFIANSYTRYRFAETDLFKTLDTLEKVTLQDINQRFKEHFNFQSFAVSIVTSKE